MTAVTAVEKLEFSDPAVFRQLIGEHEQHLKILADAARVTLKTRGTTLMVDGEDCQVQVVVALLHDLAGLLASGYPLYATDVTFAYRIKAADSSTSLREIFLDQAYISQKGSRRRPITPKTVGQKEYIDAIRRHDIVFGIGPAGTGKTYLAMAMAIAALTAKEVDRIILTRPAVEAGERLGFLPGDLLEKVNPYLRPLYDALHDMVDFTRARQLLDKGVIEVAPLAFMRGRTLNDSFVILDEAQNSSAEQMKMFLTRLGFGSRAVITGDVTQIDLPGGTSSGLVAARRILAGVEGIDFRYFTARDVVRHPLVQKIIAAYDREDARQRQAAAVAGEANAG
ncbi:MAG: PhoH family protein [Deltaproteobacteria bacterium]|nr:PhoH family protein [Candidatus Anaeroferrophillacea bacterium]